MAPSPSLPPLPPDRSSPLAALLPAYPGAPEPDRQPGEATGEHEIIRPDAVLSRSEYLWLRIQGPTFYTTTAEDRHRG